MKRAKLLDGHQAIYSHPIIVHRHNAHTRNRMGCKAHLSPLFSRECDLECLLEEYLNNEDSSSSIELSSISSRWSRKL